MLLISRARLVFTRQSQPKWNLKKDHVLNVTNALRLSQVTGNGFPDCVNLAQPSRRLVRSISEPIGVLKYCLKAIVWRDSTVDTVH